MAIKNSSKSLLTGLFLALSQAANAAPGDGHWQTPLLGGGSATASNPHAACTLQKQSFAPASPAQLPTGAVYRTTSGNAAARCSWISKSIHGIGPTVPLPAGVTFVCDNTGVSGWMEQFLPRYPGRCVKRREALPKRGPCGTENGINPVANTGGLGSNTPPRPHAGNPVIISTGEKFQNFEDFSTSDNRLKLTRFYRNSFGNSPRVAHSIPAGLGRNWQFGFAEELHINGGLSQISLLRPDGSAFSFYRETDGSFSHYDYDDQVLDFTVEFIGTWPSDPVAVVTIWKVTELRTGRTIEYQSYERPNGVSSTPLFDIARPIKITHADGYYWDFTYQTGGELDKITDSLGRELDFTWFENETTINSVLYRYESTAVSRVDLPDGTYVTYSYDHAGSLITGSERLEKVSHFDASDALIHEDTYHYETAGTSGYYWLTGITDARGVRHATWEYDNLGRVTRSKHGVDQNQHDFSYSFAGSNVYKTTVTNPLGKDTIYTFEVQSHTRKLTDVEGVASANCVASNSSYSYGSDRLVSSQTDGEGNVTQYTRNSRGLATSIVRAAGTPEAVTTTITWHSTFHMPTRIDTPNLRVDYTYSSTGLLTDRTETDLTTHTVPYSTNGQTRSWAYTHGTNGLLQSVDGPLPGTLDTTTYTYDANGYLATVTDPNSLVTTVNTVNGRGLPTQVTDANGTVSQFAYNDLGWLTSITVDPGANQSQWTIGYDAIGQVTSVTDPDNATLTMTYNDVRRLTKIENGAGEEINYVYNNAGDVVQKTIESSSSTIVFQETRTFDELSRMLTRVSQSGATWTYAHDKISNLTSKQNPRSNSTTYAYDGLNRLISITDAHTATTNVTYTAEGEVGTISDPRTITTTYVRNGFGEIIRESSPDSGTTDYVRDERGLVTQKTDGRGIVTQYSYDAGSRLTGRSYTASPSENVVFIYDSIAGGNNGLGRLTGATDASGSTAYTYDTQGRVTAHARTFGAQTYTVSYGYYPSGRLNWILYPSGRDVVFYYDGDGNLDSMVTAESSSSPNVVVAENMVWHPFGPLQTMLYGNGLTLWRTFDQDYRMDQQNVSDGATALIQQFYGYTDGLNLTNVWDNLNASENQSFWYTATERLQNADGPWGSLIFYHDDSDNRTHRILTTGGVTTTDFHGYPAASNRLTDITRNGVTHRTFTLDGAGNTLTDTESGGAAKVYTYDSRGQLKTATVGGSLKGTYVYNYAAQLVSRTLTNTTPSGTVHYIHDLDGNVIAEADGFGNVTREYIWLPKDAGSQMEGRQAISATDIPVAIVADVDTTPVMYWVHADHLNRPMAMTNAAKSIQWRATYEPFGTVQSVTGTASTDQRFPGQWYNLETGLHYNWYRHFDPTTGRYLQPDPLGMPDGPNRFAYAVNTPQMAVDPDGRSIFRPLSLPWWFKLPKSPGYCPAPPIYDNTPLLSESAPPDDDEPEERPLLGPDGKPIDDPLTETEAVVGDNSGQDMRDYEALTQGKNASKGTPQPKKTLRDQVAEGLRGVVRAITGAGGGGGG